MDRQYGGAQYRTQPLDLELCFAPPAALGGAGDCRLVRLGRSRPSGLLVGANDPARPCLHFCVLHVRGQSIRRINHECSRYLIVKGLAVRVEQDPSVIDNCWYHEYTTDEVK